MENPELSICLTGATGWLGRSLLEVLNDSKSPHKIALHGRNESTILSDSGQAFNVQLFDLETIIKQEFDVFAPLAFATRDKMNKMSEEEYSSFNKNIIADAVNVIRGGNVGSVINLSSGVVSQKSESQQKDPSYSLYADLKEFQENEFANACSDVGIPFINCRVFSVTGIDMREPSKFAIGNLVKQAMIEGSIVLNSKSSVKRRYMDSRDLMYLLIKCVGKGSSLNIESGGEAVDLVNLSKKILKEFERAMGNISFATDELQETNDYFSYRDDFEIIAKSHDYSLSSLAMQIRNVAISIQNQIT